jgi:hypothetical protein
MSREYLYNDEEDPTDVIVVDELLNGLNDWRTVPDIVRLTFKALSDVIKSHTASLRDLEIQIATKANRSELIQKVNNSDLQRLLAENRNGGEVKNFETFQTLLEEKLTRKECSYMINGKFNEIKAELDKKADLRELQNEIRGVKNLAEENNFRKGQNKEIDTIFKVLEQKANISEVNAALDEKVSKQSLGSSLSKKVNRSDLEALLLGKADMSELQSLIAILDNKADKHLLDLQSSVKLEKVEILKLIREELSKRLELNDSGESVVRIKRELDYKLNHFDKYIESLRLNIEQTQATLAEEIANKMSTTDPDVKTEITRFTSSVKSEIRKIEDKNNEKLQKIDLNLKTLSEEISDLKARVLSFSRSDDRLSFENIRSDLRLSVMKDYDKILKDVSSLKASLETHVEARFKELRQIIDSKPDRYDLESFKTEQKYTRGFSEDLEQLKRSFESVQKKSFSEVFEILESFRAELKLKVNSQEFLAGLNSKVSLEDFRDFPDDKLIIEALCSENCTGRWLWKSGEVKAGYSVPWEIQSVNTCPENFVWEKDSTAIVTMTPGLYEIFYGFFAGKKPQVQLLVNGEPVILDSLLDAKAWGRHRDGNIIGASVTDYVALPARARICVTYAGPRIVEGFISLRKL